MLLNKAVKISAKSGAFSLRAAFKRHFPTLWSAVRIIARGRFELFPPRETFALGDLHQKIKARFGKKSGFFFEVGANNGLDQSNTAYLQRYCGWTGILVEAVPHKFVECVENRPGAIVIHAALTPFGYAPAFVEIAYSNLMSISSLSAEDAAGHVAKGESFMGREHGISGTVFLAPARTVDSVLAEQGYPAIDLFSLDVEGAEMQVLQGIDFTKSRPRAFLIEVRDLDQISRFMESKGYRLDTQFSFQDYLFVDKEG